MNYETPRIFEPSGTYKTMVVNMNRFALIALVVLTCVLLWNRKKVPWNTAEENPLLPQGE